MVSLIKFNFDLCMSFFVVLFSLAEYEKAERGLKTDGVISELEGGGVGVVWREGEEGVGRPPAVHHGRRACTAGCRILVAF